MTMHQLNVSARLILLCAFLTCRVDTRGNLNSTANTTLMINSTNDTTETATELLHIKAIIGVGWGGSLLIAISALFLVMFQLGCINTKQENENPVCLVVSIDSDNDNVFYDRYIHLEKNLVFLKTFIFRNLDFPATSAMEEEGQHVPRNINPDIILETCM